MIYHLLDSRAGLLAVTNDGLLETEDNGKYILFTGSLKECCKAANGKTYGELNVVCDEEFTILWELVNENGHWSIKKLKKDENEE